MVERIQLILLENIQLIYKLVIIFLYSYFFTYLVTDRLIPKFKRKGFKVQDMYKKSKPLIANLGGMTIFIGVMASLTVSQILIKDFDISKLLIFYFIAIVFGTFGLLDDLVDVGKKWKIAVPFFMALPISLLVVDTNINFFSTTIELGVLFSLIIAPIYLMVVTNLVNMHSGYNGLASGLSIILMFFLGLKVLIAQDMVNLLYLMPIFGAVVAYYKFDKYPSRIIWGNSGSLMVGAAIGGYIILTNSEIFGIIILIPHIVDFLMFFGYNIIGRHRFEKVKYGTTRKDGTVEAPTPFKMKFLFPYFFRLTEKQNVLIMYGLSIVFGIVGLIYNFVLN